MSSQAQNNLTVTEALTILKSYSCIQTKLVESETEKEQLCEAVKLITSLTDSENIGICADNPKQGFVALSSYLKALGYDGNIAPTPIPNEPAPVYIKFNTQKMSQYLDSYEGTYRGVLIAYQSENEALVGTYGHFPLDLFV